MFILIKLVLCKNILCKKLKIFVILFLEKIIVNKGYLFLIKRVIESSMILDILEVC